MSKIPTTEPAERPFTVALSEAEMNALVNWHFSICRKIPKKVGAAALGTAFELPIFSSRRHKILFESARQLLKAHADRAQQLASIVNPNLCKSAKSVDKKTP